MKDKWLSERVLHIRNLKSPSEQQRLLLLLFEKPTPSSDDTRKLNFLIKAEWAEAKAQKAKSDVARIVNAEKEAARKARDRELYQSAGLLILAGLVDTKSGSPVFDRGELLGALLEIKNRNVDSQVRSAWKRSGDELINARERLKSN